MAGYVESPKLALKGLRLNSLFHYLSSLGCLDGVSFSEDPTPDLLPLTVLTFWTYRSDRRDFVGTGSDCASWGGTRLPTKSETRTSECGVLPPVL